MKKILSLIFLLIFSLSLLAEDKASSIKADANIVYKYKKHQEFDFENLDVQGEVGGALGDISISSRQQKDFRSKLPLRKNFDPEIKKALERVR